MATAMIPPTGEIYESERRRIRRLRENSTIDPVERWMLKEQRMQDEMIACSNAIIRQKKTRR